MAAAMVAAAAAAMVAAARVAAQAAAARVAAAMATAAVRWREWRTGDLCVGCDNYIWMAVCSAADADDSGRFLEGPDTKFSPSRTPPAHKIFARTDENLLLMLFVLTRNVFVA